MENSNSISTLKELITSIIEIGDEATLKMLDLKKIETIMEPEVKRLVDVETPWSPDYKNLIFCNNVTDVKNVITQALQQNKLVRTAGAQHSAPAVVFEKSAEAAKNCLHVKLEQELRSVTVIEEDKSAGFIRLKVGAGCNMGIDPSDPQSNASNSLNRIADGMGYALPITGGMSHQTVGGFLMTSTAGGSLVHGFADVVETIEFVDGLGNYQIVQQGSDEFNASGVSMGLFGIITYVTIKLGVNYLVKGVEETVAVNKSIIADAPTFQSALEEQEYVHCVWFAEKGVDRVLQFKGVQVSNTLPIVPYHHVLQKTYMNYAAAAVLFAVNELQNEDSAISNKIASFFLKLMSQLVSTPFCDHWYIALPNDDQALIDTVIRVQFTEIWIDVQHTDLVLSALNKLFDNDPLAAGNFGVELYGAKASPFWMSQSYGRNVIRVDPYWWEFNPTGNLHDFFTKYWNVLLTIPTARLHWGKHFPAVGQKFGNITIGPEYVQQAFPKFNEWLSLRNKYDPQQIFVTSYWRSLLGILK